MKITFEFNSLEEVKQYLDGQVAATIALSEYVVKDAPAEKPAKAEPKAEPVKQETEELPFAPAPEPKKAEKPAQTKVDESYRVEVRQVLAQLNKKTGKNTASELIKELGVSKLTDVALSDLPALMAKAQEALNA
jgi:hypothetical protein